MSRMCKAVVLGLFLALCGVARAVDDYVWVEGEKPTAQNYQAKGVGWGNQTYLSQEAWLHVSIEDRDVLAKSPKDGVIFSYDMQVPSAGQYEVWNRIGFEYVRSLFQWRIDEGAWQDIPAAQLTTDLMDIALWCEVAWIKMGEAQLTAGKHTLQVRLPITYKDKDQKNAARILYASDALCLYKGTFRPNGPNKPGQAWQQDIDKTAAEQVFELKGNGNARAELPLAGTWQVARFDEQVIEDRLGPVKATPNPDELYWKGMKVPGDRNVLRPEMLYAHRYFYRTRVKVPADLGGRGFFLHFPSVNMITTVFVNGQQSGWTKTPFAMWDCDITKALKPGQVNEVWVGIKDTFYAIAKDTRKGFNFPAPWLDSNQGISMQFDMPVWNHRQNGLLETPTLVCTGPVYVSDVFVKTSVAKKQVEVEVTLHNATGQNAEVSVSNQIAAVAPNAAAAKPLADKTVTVPAGQEITVTMTEPWDNAKLWWPDEPNLYTATTAVSLGGKQVDATATRFGFREWTWEGRQFKLNGVPWQFRADLVHHSSSNPQQAVETWKKHGQTTVRFWGTHWGGMGMKDTLDFMDQNGVCIRRSNIFDGEGANYGLTEEANVDGKNVRIPRKDLFANWAEQLKAQVRGERNHPSVFIWSIENEITYINSANFGNSRIVEPAILAVAKQVMALDPTRPTMVDGGNALFDVSLPVAGGHYLEMDIREYPDEAYTFAKTCSGLSRGLWPTPQDRPLFMGESYFVSGNPPSWYSAIGGESAFLGRSEVGRPAGLFAKMLSEGYRWQGVAGFHFWFGGETDIHYNSWQPVCVLCRQWNWTFGGGSTVPRTLKVFNDTHYPNPIQLVWQLKVDGKVVQEDSKTYTLAPGTADTTEITLNVPQVTKRTAGEFVLTASRGGKEVFREIKPIAILNTAEAAKPAIGQADLTVLDPNGSAKQRLSSRGVVFTEVAKFEDVPANVKVLVVGKDALTARQATDPRWTALAAAGAKVLVLDQTNPLHYQATPADFDVTSYAGRIAFSENLEHPVFAGLEQCDFFTWSADHIVYRNVYKKASRGAKSLAQCDHELSCSAISECAVDDGVLLLCQLVVGEKLATDPVAQRLFDNMLNYVTAYKVVRNRTAVAMDDASPAAKMLAGSGLKFDKAADVLAAVSDGKHEIVIADATPANLKALSANLDKVKAFANGGGWLMLWGLTPEGLADYNKIVGYDHVLRPFEMERVTLPAVRDPVLSGLTMRDVVMESGKKVAEYAGDRYLANDVFSQIVDFDDIAPFCEVPPADYWKEAAENDHLPRNMFNGFTAADSWKYVFSISLVKGEPTKWTMKLPREEEITGFSIVINTIYHKITKINLYFDDDPKPVTINTRPAGDRQDFAIPPHKAKTLTIEVADWEKSGQTDVIGIDNMWLRVKRPDDFAQRVRPLLNIGALVKYPIGKGGILLNQIRMMPTESVPVNAQKKANMVSTLLRNLGATYAGGRTLTAANLKFDPIPLANQANQYLTRDRGWFDDKRDLGHLPNGEQKLAGVPYAIQDFRTSPVPSCIMLAGPGVKGRLPNEFKGLKVEKTADVLFFLHTFKRTGDWRPRNAEEKPPVAFKYVIHYADGETAEVPVLYGDGVDNWFSADPHGLKSASLAWTGKFPDGGDEQAAIYQFTWRNPRPAERITSIDLAYGRDGSRWGVPALIALTAGTGQP